MLEIERRNFWLGLLIIYVSISLLMTACQVDDTHSEDSSQPKSSLLSGQHPASPEPANLQYTPSIPVPASPPAIEQQSGDLWDEIEPAGQNIQLWHSLSNSQRSTFEKFVDDFNSTNQWGITIQTIPFDSPGAIYYQMLKVLNTPEAPHLIFGYSNQFADFDLYNGLADMSGLLSSLKWGMTSDETSEFIPVSIKRDISPLHPNQRLGFPFTNSMDVLYYNKDWLAELGYSTPPKSPQEFKEIACKAVEEPFSKAEGEKSAGYGLVTNSSGFNSWTFSHNGDIFDYDGVKYDFDNDASIQVMRYLQDLVNRGCAVIINDRYADQEEFGKGNILFTISSSAGYPFYENEVNQRLQFNWDIAAIPHSGQVPVQNVYGISASIPATSSESELSAWLFLKHLSSPVVQAEWVKSTSYYPAITDLGSGITEFQYGGNSASLVIKEMVNGKSEPAVPGYHFVRELVAESMNAIMRGADPAIVLSELTEEANTIMEDQYKIPLSTMETIPIPDDNR